MRALTVIAESVHPESTRPINYPAVPRGTERLRFTPDPAHSEEKMRDLAKALVEIWDRLEMRWAA